MRESRVSRMTPRFLIWGTRLVVRPFTKPGNAGKGGFRRRRVL